MKKPLILLMAISAIIIALVIMFLVRKPKENAPTDDQVFCTQDAMECPDGSYVGRIPPKCEFQACPQ